MKYDLVIQNGTALVLKPNYQKTDLLPADRPEDLFTLEKLNIGIKDGLIQEVSSSTLEGFEKIDANHLTVLPGLIDSQVHFREPGLTHKEDLESGTRAAALGGITSIFEMPNTTPPTINRENFLDKMKRAENRCWVNYAFYMGGSSENSAHLGELEKLPGCPGVKIFMGSSTGSLLAEDDPTIESILRHTRRRLIVHSEDEYRLRERKKIALESKDVRKHHEWRDAESALKSTQRLIALAEKTKRQVHVLHISTAEEIEFLSKHKNLASLELLPQHLTLFAPDCYDRLGTKAQQNPPIRELRHQQALWKAYNSGIIDTMGSDHAPHTLEEKSKEYPQTPSGMPMVQTTVPIMLNHIHEGRTSLARFVYHMSEGPRRIFGCLKKGRIAVGLQADFTLVDLKSKWTIRNELMASRCGWTPFDGMQVTGQAISTIVGGHLVMHSGKLLASAKGQAVDFR